VSTNTDPVRQRMAAANPARPEAEPPGDVMNAAVLLDVIDDRSGAKTLERDSQQQGASTATRFARRNWAAAFAAGFAVVLIVGIAFGLLNRGGDSLDVVAPVATTTPTTIPYASPSTIPDMAPSITINVDQITHPRPGDATGGVVVADDSLWASTGEGIVRWDLDGGDPELFTSAEGVPLIEGFAPALAVAPDGTAWAYAYYPQDLVVFDGTRWSEPVGYDQIDILNPRCIPDEECLNPITAMAIGPNGLLFLAVGETTLLQFDGVDWSVLPVTPAETHGGSAWATDMAVASDGRLWVASWEELLSYDGDTWDRYTAADGLPSGMINTVAVAPNGDVWVGTTDSFDGDGSGGLARFDGNAWTVFDETDGLHDNNVVALTVGADDMVWTVHSAKVDLDSAEEVATGGISRFDGTAWSATTVADVGIGFGWGGAAIDDNGTLWITSRWGVVGFDGTGATVLRFPEGTRPPINALPSTVESQILPASEDPFEWRWGPLGGATSDVAGVEGIVAGEGCYGSGGDQGSSEGVEFDAGRIDLTLGYRVAPVVVVTDEGGTVTHVGNPFGELAWLCSVATTDTHILAVGSGVSWSEDGIVWHGIEAFEEIAGWNVDGSNLMWAAAGPGGYLVLGREGAAWYSEDLQSWYEVTLDNEGFGTSIWGWIGPSGAAVGEEIIIDMGGEGWVGTRREG
jgi:hypothetical protein